MEKTGNERAANILHILIWIFSCAALVFSVIMIDINWNLFNWEGPLLDKWTAFFTALIFVSVFFMLQISKKAVVNKSTYILLGFALFVLVFGILSVIGQEGTSEAYFGRKEMPPAWYQLLRVLIHTAPLLVWFFSPLNIFRKNRQN